jgi:hypothetical protein
VKQAACRTARNPLRHHPPPRRRRQRPCRTSLQHGIPPGFPPPPQTAPRPPHRQALVGGSPSPATPRTPAPPAAAVTAQPPAPEPPPTDPATQAPSGSTQDPGSPRATASGPRIEGTPTPRSGTPAAEVLPKGSGGADLFAACVAHLTPEPTEPHDVDGPSLQTVLRHLRTFLTSQ